MFGVNMRMALSESQFQRVRRMCQDEWESEEELWQFFKTITDAKELHLFADGFNWYTGVEEWRRVIRHSLCDRGTALLIHWRGAPGWYGSYADRSETRNPDQANHFNLLREIEQKIVGGYFRTHLFPLQPQDDRGHDMTTLYGSVGQKRQVPPEMFV